MPILPKEQNAGAARQISVYGRGASTARVQRKG